MPLYKIVKDTIIRGTYYIEAKDILTAEILTKSTIPDHSYSKHQEIIGSFETYAAEHSNQIDEWRRMG